MITRKVWRRRLDVLFSHGEHKTFYLSEKAEFGTDDDAITIFENVDEERVNYDTFYKHHLAAVSLTWFEKEITETPAGTPEPDVAPERSPNDYELR